MKLLFCRNCRDVQKLAFTAVVCSCGSSHGRYLPDGRCAEIEGVDAEVIGLDSFLLARALELFSIDAERHGAYAEFGPPLSAWLFPHGYSRIQRKKLVKP